VATEGATNCKLYYPTYFDRIGRCTVRACSGFAGGGQAGYNYLLGPVVLGGEIDFQGSTFAAGVNGGGPFGTTKRMPWFGTMRARVGYPGSVMPYLTGGAVWGQRSIDGPISASANYWTWTAGGGIEGLVTERWSMKLECLYMGTPSTSLLPGSNETANNNLVRVGVNYHFKYHLTLRSRAKRGVSKGGNSLVVAHPSRRTLRVLLRVRFAVLQPRAAWRDKSYKQGQSA